MESPIICHYASQIKIRDYCFGISLELKVQDVLVYIGSMGLKAFKRRSILILIDEIMHARYALDIEGDIADYVNQEVELKPYKELPRFRYFFDVYVHKDKIGVRPEPNERMRVLISLGDGSVPTDYFVIPNKDLTEATILENGQKARFI